MVHSRLVKVELTRNKVTRRIEDKRSATLGTTTQSEVLMILPVISMMKDKSGPGNEWQKYFTLAMTLKKNGSWWVSFFIPVLQKVSKIADGSV